MSEKTANFIKTVGLLARNEFLSRDKWILPSICIAQAALESGWNLNASSVFGIKGNGFTSTTSEFYDGNYVQIQDSFRAYPDLASSIIGYYDFLRDTPRYANALNNSNYQDAVDKLIHTIDGYPYATDPDYIAKITSIIEDFELTQYDVIEPVIPIVEQTDVQAENVQPQVTEEPQQSNGSYIVQSGDTLSGIASSVGLGYQELAEFNGIENPNMIYPGQVINFPGIVESQPVEQPQSEQRTYTVESGDSLWGIAATQLGDGSRYQEIKNINGLQSDTIYPGNILVLPQ